MAAEGNSETRPEERSQNQTGRWGGRREAIGSLHCRYGREGSSVAVAPGRTSRPGMEVVAVSEDFFLLMLLKEKKNISRISTWSVVFLFAESGSDRLEATRLKEEGI